MFKKDTKEILVGRALSIGIGTRLQFQLGVKGQECKAAGVLVGMVPDEYLMVRAPAIPGILGRLDDGNPIVVRYVYSGNVYGFTSRILTYIHKPALIVFLTFPSAVEALNLRKGQRMECLFPATVKTDMGNCKALIVDISLGGCRIGLDHDAAESLSIDIDQTVGISFFLMGIAEEQEINGNIRNLKKDSQFSEMGVLFDQGNEAVLKNVKQYIKLCQATVSPAC